MSDKDREFPICPDDTKIILTLNSNRELKEEEYQALACSGQWASPIATPP